MIALFPHIKDNLKNMRQWALNENNLICREISCQNIKTNRYYVDAALDPFTSHGHDGVYKWKNIER